MFRKISRFIHPDKTKDTEKHEAFNVLKQMTSNGFLYKKYIYILLNLI